MVQVSEKCYYINCPAKIGVYVADKDNVYLVDSGNDKDAGRKVRQILERNGWHVQGDGMMQEKKKYKKFQIYTIDSNSPVIIRSQEVRYE